MEVPCEPRANESHECRSYKYSPRICTGIRVQDSALVTLRGDKLTSSAVEKI